MPSTKARTERVAINFRPSAVAVVGAERSLKITK